jgi:carbamoyltransferase
MPDRWILGINASHTGAACLLRNDRIVVAVQEERLTRVKRDRMHGATPALAIRYCLDEAGITARELTAIGLCVQGRATDDHEQVANNPLLADAASRVPVFTVGHHMGHAASAFACAGFDEAAVLVIDGSGSPLGDVSEAERAAVVRPIADGWETASIYKATRAGIVPVMKQVAASGAWLTPSPTGMATFRSLGGMYSAAALQIFGAGMDAGKVMGLAGLGRPTFPTESFWTPDGHELTFHDTVPACFRHHRRWPEEEAAYIGLAASVQVAIEEAVLRLARAALETDRGGRLCFAGGVALNGLANERLIRETGLTDLYVIPAAEDSGTAIGAAYCAWWGIGGAWPRRYVVRDSMGKRYPPRAVEAAIASTPGIRPQPAAGDAAREAARRLAEGEIVGWFEGGAELGPRALGHRSILCDPRRADGQAVLNARVKHREGFRPFAPAILAEHAGEWFEFGGTRAESPFMLRVCHVKPDCRARIPAVVHVDGTARVQTVSREHNLAFHTLIAHFHALTGVPIVLNTSFNDAGEPIVETPEDALWCLLGTGIDSVVLEGVLCAKASDAEWMAECVPHVTAHARAHREGTHYHIAHPWGEAVRTVASGTDAAVVMTLIDERRSVADIVEALAGRADGWSQTRVCRVLRGLRGIGIVSLPALAGRVEASAGHPRGASHGRS